MIYKSIVIFRYNGDFDSNKVQENPREKKLAMVQSEKATNMLFGAVSVCSPLSGSITLIPPFGAQ